MSWEQVEDNDKTGGRRVSSEEDRGWEGLKGRGKIGTSTKTKFWGDKLKNV